MLSSFGATGSLNLWPLASRRWVHINLKGDILSVVNQGLKSQEFLRQLSIGSLTDNVQIHSLEIAVLVEGGMLPESWKLVWRREVMKMDIYYCKVKGKYSVELSKLCLASSGLPGWGFGPSDSGRLIGNQRPTSLLRCFLIFGIFTVGTVWWSCSHIILVALVL